MVIEKQFMPEAALFLAVTAHMGQLRDPVNGFSEAYVFHPIRVYEDLKRQGVTDPEILAAAILHDVVEDTEIELDTILYEYGERVGHLVWCVTRQKADGETYMDFIRRLAEVPDAVLIKRADIADNLRTLPDEKLGLARRYAKALAYFDEKDKR